MSKLIRITEEYTRECVAEFLAALREMRMTDGKVQYSKILGAQDRRATLYFTPSAWTKMQLLIKNFDKEVAWHGVATRGDDPEKDEYTISDILVYPQTVTSTTVETDQAEYEKWLCDLPDEIFNNLRMQGHSHVNMGVSPSGVDTTHQGKILQQLDEDMFYIFLIWNKAGASWIKIYDFSKNAMFDSSDVDVRIIGDDFDHASFIKDARELVKNQTYSAPKSGGYYGGGQSSGYGATTRGPWKPEETPKKAEEKAEPEPEKKTGGNAASTAAAEEAADDDGWKTGNSSSSGRKNYYDDDDDASYYDDDEAFWSGRYLRDPFYARGY